MGLLEEHHIMFFLLQVVVLLGVAKLLGELFRKWGQPPLTAEVLVGVILGETILGTYAPSIHRMIFPPHPENQIMLETVSWIGVLFLLLSSGLDVDLSVAWKQRKSSLIIALSDIILPLLFGFLLALLIPDKHIIGDRRFLFALFVGTAMTISDLPIALRALSDTNILRSDLGLLILSALTINDIIGWVIFTITLSLAAEAVGLGYIVGVLTGTIGFAVVCLLPGRRAVNHLFNKVHALNLPQPGTTLTMVVLLGGLCGFITELMGIHALFGFFIAGIMVAKNQATSERIREIIHQMVYSIFVPLFFISIGLRVNFLADFNIPLVLSITVIGIAGRFLGAYVGTLKTDVPRDDRTPLSIGHTPSGAMGIVVALLALDVLIDTEVFVAIIFSAIVSAVIVGPWMAWSLKKVRRARILDMFAPRAFLLRLSGETPDAVIRELSDSISMEEALPDAATIAAAVMDREITQSTAIGEGVACPHARLAELQKPKTAFGMSPQGIEWDSPDGKPVRFVFMILTPADDYDSQVKLLSGIARVMIQPNIKEALLAAGNKEQAWSILRKEMQRQMELELSGSRPDN